MAVIHFTAADALQTKVVEAGVYPSIISDIQGPTKSTSGKSVNYYVAVQIADGKYKGKTLTIVFNSESNSPSLLGDRQYYPQAYFLQLESAITGRVIDPTDYALDTDNLLMKKFEAGWGIGTVDGRLINVINGFYQNGYGAQAPAF